MIITPVSFKAERGKIYAMLHYGEIQSLSMRDYAWRTHPNWIRDNNLFFLILEERTLINNLIIKL